MRVNKVQELWKNRQTVIGGWLTIPSGFSGNHGTSELGCVDR
jgi:hypothetical protein